MKINFWELLPDYEPLPALTRMPKNYKNWYGEGDVIGDGSVRWCACRSFQMIVGSRFGWPEPGETRSPEPVNPKCMAVTRSVLHQNHHKVLLAKLAVAQGFGYKACLVDDQTPREPSEVAELFGLKLTGVFWTLVANTKAAVERRGRHHKVFAKKGRTGDSDTVEQANRIARMV